MKPLAVIACLCIAALAAADTLLVEASDPTPELTAWAEARGLELEPTRNGAELALPDTLLAAFNATGAPFHVVDSFDRMSRALAGYPSPQEAIDSLYALAAQYPSITRLIDLGPSTCHQYYLAGDSDYADYQYNVLCLKVSDNPEVEEDEANVYFMGLIHAREAISLPVTQHILEYLLQNYGVDPQVTQWIDDNQIWFTPLINPDGYHASWETLHTLHRKNMRDTDNNGAPTYSVYDGVDMNRNFGYVWGPNGTSSYYGSNQYNGPSPWSETEVCYLRDLIQARKFWGGITYHSYGQWVLYPLGHLPGACSFDHNIMNDLAVGMAATIPRITTAGTYTPAQAVDFGYTCQGTMGDWGYAEERLFSYTIELATTYIPSASQIETICNDNLQAALMFLDRASSSVVTGHVVNADGEPLVADVHVAEIDDATGMSSVEPARSGALFGRYWRILRPGGYTFTFSAEDYLPVTVENVTVSDTGRTVLDVTLPSVWTPGVAIAVNNGQVTLSWEAAPDTTYTVYTAAAPDGEFAPAAGAWLSPGVWRQQTDDERRYYRVKRSLR